FAGYVPPPVLPSFHSQLLVLWHSELQPRLAGGIRKCRDTTVVVVSAPVENHTGNAGFACPGSCQFADLGRFGLLVAGQTTDIRFHAARRRHGVSGPVVDELHSNVPRRTGHHHPWLLRGADDLLAYPGVLARASNPALSRDILADRAVLLRRLLVRNSRFAHDHLPVFPTLRRMRSPS